ncbi:Phage protein [Thauera aromatica K172]|uniref:Phage protein n=1 Tax=Thauera aromatica K172 TaxID=44139 RepID=A0A2R4BNY9_THAAR|nr:Phage protein [Thauera aromatica K172]
MAPDATAQDWSGFEDVEDPPAGPSLTDRAITAGKKLFENMAAPFERAPEKPDTVMAGFEAPPAAPRTTPANPASIDFVRQSYERFPESRPRLLARQDWVGDLARQMDAEYRQGDAATAGLPAAQNLDGRKESRIARGIEQGMDADAAAMTAASQGAAGVDAPVARAVETPDTLADKLAREHGDSDLVRGAVNLAGSVAKVAPTTGKMALDVLQLAPLVGRAAEWGSDALADVIEDISKSQSRQMQGKSAKLAEVVRNGTPDQVMQHLVQNPDLLADVAIPSAGSIFLIGGAGAATGKAVAGRYAGRVSERALARIQQRAATDGAVWANAAANAGSAYAETEGGDLAKYTAALIAGLGTRAVGKLTAGGAEGVVARGTAGTANPVVAAGRTAAVETAQEFGEGASEALGSQTGQIVEGTRDGLDLRQIANHGTMEAAAAGPMGAAVGAINAAPAQAADPEQVAAEAAYRGQVDALARQALDPSNAQWAEVQRAAPVAPEAPAAMPAMADVAQQAAASIEQALQQREAEAASTGDAAELAVTRAENAAVRSAGQPAPAAQTSRPGTIDVDQDALLAQVEAVANAHGNVIVTGERAAEAVKAVAPEAPTLTRKDGAVMVSTRFAGPVMEAVAGAKQRVSTEFGDVAGFMQGDQGEGRRTDVSEGERNPPVGAEPHAGRLDVASLSPAGLLFTARAHADPAARDAAAAELRRREEDYAYRQREEQKGRELELLHAEAVDQDIAQAVARTEAAGVNQHADSAMAAAFRRAGAAVAAPAQAVQPDIPPDTNPPNPAQAQAKAADARSRLKPDPTLTQRAMPVVDDLRAMAQDAGWAEQGGKLIRDAEGKASRTKWIPRAEWFLSGMEARPDVLAQHIEDAAQGKWIPVKSARTIEGMMEWLDAQRNPGYLAPEDQSMYDFEASFDAVLNNPDAREVAEFFDDAFGDFAEQSEADAMRTLGFTEEEIANAGGQTEAGAGSAEATDVRGAATTGERAGETGAAQTQAGAAGQQEGLTLETYTSADIAQREAEQTAQAEADARAEREAAAKQRQEEGRAEVRRRSEAAADTFELGMDPMENLTGQGGLKLSRSSQFRPDPYDAQQYALAVDRIAAMETAPRSDLTVGDTPAVLRALGARALPIQMPSSMIHKASRPAIRGHDVPVAALRDLPALLADPVMVFDSKTEKGALVALVDARDDSDRPVVVAVHLDAKGGGFHRINKVASIYGKDDAADIERWMRGSLRYYQTEKASGWLRAVGLQLPEANTIKRLNPRVITDEDVVNLRYSFAGQNARTADTMALDVAQRRIEAGEDAEVVRRETGWHRGADGKWRFEINDADAGLVNMREDEYGGSRATYLSDILDHPALFAAYPELRSMDVVISFSPGSRERGMFEEGHPGDDQTFGRSPQITVEARTKDDALSVLLHEIQHGIQEAEGFATGGSIASLEETMPSPQAMNDAKVLRARMDRGESLGEARAWFLNTLGRDAAPEASILAEENSSRDLGRMPGTPAEKYRRLAGEVEARNAQARQRMTDAERRAMPPSATADVADEDVIVVFNGTEMASAPTPANAVATHARPSPMTAEALRAIVARQLPSLAGAVDQMLGRGEAGQRGGLVLIEQGDDVSIARAYAEKTGNDPGDVLHALQGDGTQYSDAGDVQGFHDSDSGLTFLVLPHLADHTAAAVLLHEATHGKQRAEIDARALALIEVRDNAVKPVREFLTRVAQRMDDAGETGNAAEAAAYIVEQAVTEGRQAGFSTVDGALMNWIDRKLGKRVGDLVRDFVAMVRAWGLRRGVALNPSIDDLVALAKLNVRDMARGDVAGQAGQSRIGDALKSALRGLVALARSAGNENKTVTLGTVTDQQASLLQRENVPVDVSFKHTADMFAVRHALNRHGDAKAEAKRGQLPLVESDISAIPEIVSTPDAWLLGAKTPRGQDIVGSLKRLPDGAVLYLEEVRSGRKTLAMTSMRKYPGTTDFEAIKDRIVPSYARSDTGDVRIVIPEDSGGQAGRGHLNFSRAGQAALPAQHGSAGFELPPWKKTDTAQERIQDRYNRLRDVVKAVAEQGGVVTDLNNFDWGEDRFHGVASNRIEQLGEKTKAILEDVKASGVSLDEVVLYAYAEHAPERNAEMQSINAHVKTGSGMSDAEAKAIIDKARQEGTDAKLARLADAIRRIARDTLQLQLDSGLITQGEFDAYNAKYRKWVPLRGFETIDEDGRTFRGTGRGFNIRGSENLRALGRDSKAGQLFENIMLDAERAIVRGTKNTEVNHRFLQFIIDNPDPDLWEIDAQKTKQGFKNGKVTLDSLVDKGDGTIGVKVKGHVVYLKIHDRKLFEQMANHWNDVEFGAIPYIGAFNRYLSKSYTAWSPEFALYTNPARDLQAALFSITGREGIGMTGLFAKNYPRAVLAAYRGEAMPNIPGVKAAKDPLYEEYKAMGGKTGFWNLNTLESKVKEIETLVKEMESLTIKNSWRVPVKAAKALERLVTGHAGALENATRLAAYMAMREAGRSKAEAAHFAKNLNVNFNRRGTWTAGLGSIFLFFNPAVQGVHNMYETLVHGKHKGQAWALIGAGMAGMAALAVLNAMAGDDDDGIPYWDKIPQYEKERNIIIVLPSFAKDIGQPIPDSTGRYFKIPLPYQWNVPMYAATLAVDVHRNSENAAHGIKPGSAAVRLAVSGATSFMPVTGYPPTYAPVHQHFANKSGFGDGPLYPETQWNKHKPDSEKYGAGMHDTGWQKWAAFVNEATGGNQFEEGLISMPPSVWRNYARAYLGGPMSFLSGSYDAIAEEDITKAPFLRKAYGEIGFRQDQSKFYEVANQALPAFNAHRDARKVSPEIATEMMKSNEVMISVGSFTQAYMEQLGRTYEQDKRTKDSKMMTEAEKRMQLKLTEKRRSDIHEAYLKRWREAVGNVK